MVNILEIDMDVLKRDLRLRGYTDSEITEVLELPLFIIPGPVTEPQSDKPEQKLTNHQVMISKELQRHGLDNKIIVNKNVPRRYIEERHAHVELGTFVISGLMAAQQLNAIANVAQIADAVLNYLQYWNSRGRTKELTRRAAFQISRFKKDGDDIDLVIAETELPEDQVAEVLRGLFPKPSDD